MEKKDKEESGFSDCSDSTTENEKDKKEPKFAAIRFFVQGTEKNEVKFIKVERIQNFDSELVTFPYDALVSTDYDEDEQLIYEPACILATSSSKSDLENRKSRWPNPKKRRSEVLQDLANKNLLKNKDQAKIKGKARGRPPKAKKVVASANRKVTPPPPPPPFEEANVAVAQQLKSLNHPGALQFELPAMQQTNEEKLVETLKAKDDYIAQLKKELQEAQNKNNAAVVTAAEVHKVPANHSDTFSSTSPSVTPVVNSTLQGSSPSCPSILVTPASSRQQIVSHKKMTPTILMNRSPSTPSPLKKSPRNNGNGSRLAFGKKSDLRKPKQKTGDADEDSSSEESNYLNEILSRKAARATKGVTLATRRSPRNNSNGSRLFFNKQRAKQRIGDAGIKSSTPGESNSCRREEVALDNKVQNFTEKSVKPIPSKRKSTSPGSRYPMKKKMKYVRRTTDISYDSDDYSKSGLKQRGKLEEWTLNTLDPNTGEKKKMSMTHISYGVSVPKHVWKRAMKAKSPAVFLRELVLYIWDKDLFIQLAVKPDKTHNPDNRLAIEPRKYCALKVGYILYLICFKHIKREAKIKTEGEVKDRNRRINKFGRELGVIIDEVRRKPEYPYGPKPVNEEDPDDPSNFDHHPSDAELFVADRSDSEASHSGVLEHEDNEDSD